MWMNISEMSVRAHQSARDSSLTLSILSLTLCVTFESLWHSDLVTRSICPPGVRGVGFPDGASGKESPCQCRALERRRCDPRVGKTPWSRKWQLTPVFLPEKFHRQRSLVRYSPWESDTTEHTHTHTMQPLTQPTQSPLPLCWALSAHWWVLWRLSTSMSSQM